MENNNQHLWKNNELIYDKIIQHPFISEMINGTLSKEIFKYYIMQDAMYLYDFSKVLSILAARSYDTCTMLEFIKFSHDAILVEMNLHNDYFRQFNEKLQPEKSPSCFSYTNYILATCMLQTYEQAIAAVLPCFWIYKEVGTYMKKHTVDNNFYINWIDEYSSEVFVNSVNQLLVISEAICKKTTQDSFNKMIDAFNTSFKLEYIFWDSAYKLEKWSI